MSNQTADIHSAIVEDFTCLGRAELVFVRGLNVFVGQTGTGKSHMLKLLSATLRGVDAAARRAGTAGPALDAEVQLADRLKGVFRPERLGQLVRRAPGSRTARISVTFDVAPGRVRLDPLDVDYAFSARARKRVVSDAGLPGLKVGSVYLPAHDVMSLYPGLVGPGDGAPDETCRDLWPALALAEGRRARRGGSLGAAVAELQARLGARLVAEGGRLYVKSDAGRVEAHLAGAGLRRLTTVMHLALDGRLAESTALLWDAPAAGLDPGATPILVDLLHALVDGGVQVFIASQDYLLTEALSLAAERAKPRDRHSRFFLFHHGADGVEVEAAESLLDLSANPIADAFSAHYAAALDAP